MQKYLCVSGGKRVMNSSFSVNFAYAVNGWIDMENNLKLISPAQKYIHGIAE